MSVSTDNSGENGGREGAREAWLRALAEGLEERRRGHLLRELREVESRGPTLVMEGREYVQFASNNYLGMANDPEVIDAARAATARWGTGSGASRLVTGSLAIHHELETALARFKRAEAALLFPTGYMANLAVLTTFAGAGDVVVSDKLNHASLLDAAKFSGGHHRTFPHLRYGRAAELLQRGAPALSEGDDASAPPFGAAASQRRAIATPKQKFLVTDSVFSMDGDLANLPAACDAAENANALVIIDEAHGTGVLGPRGAGVAELQNVEDRITLTVGTLSKALGSIGGFVAGPRAAIDTLITAARSFIYTTALPAGCAAAALAALGIVEHEPTRRQRVLRHADHVRAELTALGFDCGTSATPIIPVILGDADHALKAAAFLQDRGIYAPAIRPPTVPPGSARLRVNLMATHSDAHIEQLIEGMRALREKMT